VACGTCLYATGLASSLHRTVDAKAEVFVGGLASIELNGRQTVPQVPGIEQTTAVLSLYRPRLETADGPEVTVLAIDPTTFARGASWDDGYADRSLADLLRSLSRTDALEGVPAIAVDIPDDDVTAVVDLNPDVAMDVHVVARARAFPGLRRQPLLVVSSRALQSTYPKAVTASTEQLWTRGSLEPLVTRLRGAGLQVRSTLAISEVSAAPSLEAVLQTLRILRGLGLLVAILAALGLIVYVDVRARQRRLASVLTRRMGLHTRADWVASWLELGGAAGTGMLVGGVTGLGLVAYVSALLDPVPLVPPGPLVALPLTYAAVLAAATLVLTAISAAVSLRGTGPDAAVLRAG
jgi:putative ABC transport system permease protein